jgi:ATP-dependent Clp protease adaptor protein ClpS
MALKREDSDTSVMEQIKTDYITVDPELFRVILLNDDFTPMQFVTAVLIEIFDHTEETAEKIMLDVHEKGSGVAGTYVEDVAISKANITMNAAREHQFPLKLRVEKEA